MGDVIMPKMGDAMTEGKVLRWMKHPGDQVAAGDALAEIETDKVNVELPAEEAGTLVKVLVSEGQSVEVGSPIAVIGAAGEAATGDGAAPREAAGEAPPRADAAAAQPAPESATPKPAGAPQRQPAQPQQVPAEERIKASPLARRVAADHGVDLAAIQGTGPEGRVTKEDVEAFLQARPAAPAAAATAAPPVQAPPGAPRAPSAAPLPAPTSVPPLRAEEIPLTRMRQTIARRMTESKQQIPHFYVTVDIPMDDAVSVRRQMNEGLGEKLVSLNDLIMKAAAVALRAFPNLNASFVPATGADAPSGAAGEKPQPQGGEKVQRHGAIHVGMAVALDAGLLVPVIRDCDGKSVVAIAREAKDIGQRARAGRLHPDELTGGTFTVSNLGMFDVASFVAVINPPQAAILAVGSAVPRPVVVDGQLRAAQIMSATLSADHRVTDGAEAARYLGELRRLLQNPILLLTDLT